MRETVQRALEYRHLPCRVQTDQEVYVGSPRALLEKIPKEELNQIVQSVERESHPYLLCKRWNIIASKEDI